MHCAALVYYLLALRSSVKELLCGKGKQYASILRACILGGMRCKAGCGASAAHVLRTVLLPAGFVANAEDPASTSTGLTYAFVTGHAPPPPLQQHASIFLGTCLGAQLPVEEALIAPRARFFLGTWNMKGFLSEERPIRTLREVLQRLNDVYCSTIGYEVRQTLNPP